MDSPAKQFFMNAVVKKFWFKGKGILVPVFYFIAFFSAGVTWSLTDSYQIVFENQTVEFSFFCGSILLIGGAATWFAGRDFIQIDGKRVEIDLNNVFFFIKMKTLGTISMIIGLLIVCCGLYVFLASKFFS